jgi:hypothetical protein
VAIVHRLGERKGNAGTDADKRGLLDAEFRRDLDIVGFCKFSLVENFDKIASVNAEALDESII